MFLLQPHEHVGQGTSVSLLKDERETQQVGDLETRNCEYVHVTFHVTAMIREVN